MLIKLIDARQKLSVQVHPDDAYAARVEPGGTALGKTEMWVVLDCEPGASLLCNFRRLPEPGELERRIRDNTLAGLLQQVPVRPGDVIFIPSGTIHAIGEGIVLAEVQQNSNTTYRVFDYGRRDKDGNLRELHVDKALEVIRPGTGLPPVSRAASPGSCGKLYLGTACLLSLFYCGPPSAGGWIRRSCRNGILCLPALCGRPGNAFRRWRGFPIRQREQPLPSGGLRGVSAGGKLPAASHHHIITSTEASL